MISFDEIKALIKERQIKAYGLDYQVFLSLPRDIQEAIIAKYYEIGIQDKTDKMNASKILEKVLSLKKNK